MTQRVDPVCGKLCGIQDKNGNWWCNRCKLWWRPGQLPLEVPRR